MYQLYYHPLNASLAPHFILEELDVEFELKLVDRKSNAQKSKEYLALNPAGKIPALVDIKGDDKFVLFESGAICLYLCEQNPGANLIPEAGTEARAKFYQWLLYLNSTVQPEFMIYFYGARHTVDPDGVPSMVAAQEYRLKEMFELLDKELANKPYLLGDDITGCDFVLLMLSIWGEGLKTPPLEFANLRRYLRELAKRPAVQRTCEVETISLAKYG